MGKVNRPSSWARGSGIGRGSFGTVSLAVNKLDGQVSAVKSVELGSCSEARVAALENEIRILRRLSSPWVVEYFRDDVTVEDGATSFRNLHLEYLPGGTVADLAKRFADDVDESLVKSYTWCVVSALRYVHSLGIMHCDVKGRNVLVGPTVGAAKLADFGSAAEIDAVSPAWGARCGWHRRWFAGNTRGRSQMSGRWGVQSSRWSPENRRGRTTGARHAVENWFLGRVAGDADSVVGTRLGLCRKVSPSRPVRSVELRPVVRASVLYHHRHRQIRLLTHRLVACSIGRIPNSKKKKKKKKKKSHGGRILKPESTLAGIEIGKLATKTGAIWESDGWVMVRSVISDRAGEVSEACCLLGRRRRDKRGISEFCKCRSGNGSNEFGIFRFHMDKFGNVLILMTVLRRWTLDAMALQLVFSSYHQLYLNSQY
ncbi:mitogen-activated protein kinase kinase kinase 13 [Actinidia rufa]|uniref:Mitogen-activated protein kinase kinase kinase 13 n=1 Tax=Actinidia rufa TaxID=165716 RepID=A0A7J0H954_9ERIC|nr:mitogen-activated protein kinase kinase kinase 13 [Actinidia rufa]